MEVVATSGPRRIPAPPPDPLRTIATRERTRVEVALARIRDGDTWRDAAGRTTLFVSGHLIDVRAGDRLRVFGQLRSIRRPANPGEFDFAAYSRAERRLCAVDSEFPECVDIAGAAASPREHRPHRRLPAHRRRVAAVAQPRPAAQRLGGGHVPRLARRTGARRRCKPFWKPARSTCW